MTIAERQRSLQDQLRAHHARLAEARTTLATLRTQCAQLEGALALCNALLTEEAQPIGPNGADQPDA